MQKNMTIKKLIFDHNNLSGKSLSMIHLMMWENTTLEVLSFNSCSLTKEAGDSLGMGLIRNINLKELYLRDN